jgi:hypothetical protein
MANSPTSKQQVSRILPDYYKRSDYIRRHRNIVTLVAAVLAIGLVAAVGLSHDWHTAGISPGPVARVHATWEQQCSACHESFSPINEAAQQSMSLVGGGGLSATAVVTSAESKCQVCHPGPPHNPHQVATEEQSCTSCHPEHRGREAPLTEMDDFACTRCHAQIKQHFAKDPVAANVKDVTGFQLQHPDFRSLLSDPTRLKFNHRRHLVPGLRLPEERETKKPRMVADVSLDARDRYRRSEASATEPDNLIPVQLMCSDCHRTIAQATAAQGATKVVARGVEDLPRNQSPHETSAYLLPVNYDEHCRGCHPLTLERSPGDRVTEVLNDRQMVPHRLENHALRQFIEGRFWEQQTDGGLKKRLPWRRVRPLPGASPERLEREIQADINQQIAKVEAHLQGVVCAYCHDMHDPAQRDGLVAVENVNMPAIWLQKAFFNHTAHQHVHCRECHESAFPDSPGASTRTQDVLIAGLETCRKCHGPVADSGQVAQTAPESTQASTAVRRGADFRCVECHRYHRGDLPVEGRRAKHTAVGQLVAPLREGNHAGD